LTEPWEGLWANLKGCELANRCCADRQELVATAQVGSVRVVIHRVRPVPARKLRSKSGSRRTNYREDL
jgi:hypothetical protein